MRVFRFLVSVPLRMSVAVVMWLILVEGGLQDLWLAGGVSAVAAVSSYLVLAPGVFGTLRWLGLVRYGVYFAAQSVLGGIDVACRAFSPRMPVTPTLDTVELGLPRESARILYAWTVSLLPGTASVHLDGQRLVVHFLVDSPAAHEELRTLEGRVARLLAQPKTAPPHPPGSQQAPTGRTAGFGRRSREL